MMALQKERGVNPLAGCLPILPQIPVFISLFHVLRRLAPARRASTAGRRAHRPGRAGASCSARRSRRSFNMSGAQGDARSWRSRPAYTDIRVVALVLIVIMCVTTFFTQKQIMKRSGPVEGQAAMVQRLMLYGMPLEPARLRLLLPDRRPHLLVHQQPVDPGPAVLHPAQDAAARVAGRPGQGRRGQAGRRPADARPQARRQAGPPEARPSRHRPRRRRTGDRRRRRRAPADDRTPTAPTATPRSTAGRRRGRRAAARQPAACRATGSRRPGPAEPRQAQAPLTARRRPPGRAAGRRPAPPTTGYARPPAPT